MRVALVTAVVIAMFPAAAMADNTPAGPATLLYQWTGAVTLEGRPPEVLVGARLELGAGGMPGTIRIRAGYQDVNLLGDPVRLPAEPGTFVFPAPHIRWDSRGGELGFDQVTGEHAVFSQSVCEPAKGFNDPCKLTRVTIGGETVRGAKLAITGIYEVDRDQDLVGDTTEDRTDLKLSATPVGNDDGRLRIALTITNAGPRSADLPWLNTTLADARFEGCRAQSDWWLWTLGRQCLLAQPLAAGESRTVNVSAPSPTTATAVIGVASEGADLVAGDNSATVTVPSATPFELLVGKSQRLRDGLKVQVRGVRDGPARIMVSYRVGAKTVTVAKVVTLSAGAMRTVTLKARGAKLRTLQRAARKHSLKAQITVRSGGRLLAGGQTTVRR